MCIVPPALVPRETWTPLIARGDPLKFRMRGRKVTFSVEEWFPLATLRRRQRFGRHAGPRWGFRR